MTNSNFFTFTLFGPRRSKGEFKYRYVVLSSYTKKENMNPKLSWKEIKEPILGWVGTLIQSSGEYYGEGESISLPELGISMASWFCFDYCNLQTVYSSSQICYVCIGSPYFLLGMDNLIGVVISQKIPSFFAAYYDSYSYFIRCIHVVLVSK